MHFHENSSKQARQMTDCINVDSNFICFVAREIPRTTSFRTEQLRTVAVIDSSLVASNLNIFRGYEILFRFPVSIASLE
jgi:hypothetical protein